ncbi:class I SAM-dependent methyltransferase [Peterkaempfera griseoplana]|uniref:class I SAM-dependent methyltransferase n=1 Tax=Peterkaempfera griseoplana TaxID=66896 RepID=UPI0006E18CF6|nr:class I SAM-dependent methyltransferase [Peterkaempfera griseoplana]
MTEPLAAAHPPVPEEILAYYARGQEDARLRSGAGRLEFWRTQDVLRRLLPPAPARVLDVGGGSGVHAAWLAADGYRVELLDPVPLHVAQAAELPGVTARHGDARSLPAADGSADAVLLLGPLYHLTERADRVAALAEAARVARPGGLVVAATINRWAGLHDLLNQGRYFDAATQARVHATVDDGRTRSIGPEATFTTAYFHRPDEVPAEFAEAGLVTTGQYGVEGAAWLMGDVVEWLDDPARRAMALDAVRRTESEPSLLGVSSHLLTAATAPSRP